MKKLFCYILAFVVLLFSIALAVDYDLSSMTDSELESLRDRIDEELARRAIETESASFFDDNCISDGELNGLLGDTTPYEEFLQLDYDDFNKNPILIEVVITDVIEKNEDNYTVEYWIKGNDVYHMETEDIDQSSWLSPSKELKPKKGQRIIYRLCKHYSFIYWGSRILDTYIIDENIDIVSFEKWNLANNSNKALSHLADSFDEENFDEMGYKKILRSPEEYEGFAIKLEGVYFQELLDPYQFGLFRDTNNNVYRLYICELAGIRNTILDFKLLVTDKIRVYGYIDKELYTYSSWAGEQTVPTIRVRKIILLEDD